MIEYLVFWVSLFGVTGVTYKVLLEIDLAKYFRNKRPAIIYTAYTLISLTIGYILTSLILDMISFIVNL